VEAVDSESFQSGLTHAINIALSKSHIADNCARVHSRKKYGFVCVPVRLSQELDSLRAVHPVIGDVSTIAGPMSKSPPCGAGGSGSVRHMLDPGMFWHAYQSFPGLG
jgi:hypothetical protein